MRPPETDYIRGEEMTIVTGSALELDFQFQMQAAGLPIPEFEYMFAKKIGRLWRFDIAYPDRKIAVELEGGVWTRGRHTRGKGFINDCDKYNAATLMGWRVFRFTRDHVDSGTALKTLEDALGV